jgi:hypothetical protein
MTVLQRIIGLAKQRAMPGSALARLRGPQPQIPGRSRGVFGTKLHVVVDALGLPVRFVTGPGQQNDMAPACGLAAGLASGKVIRASRAFLR